MNRVIEGNQLFDETSSNASITAALSIVFNNHDAFYNELDDTATDYDTVVPEEVSVNDVETCHVVKPKPYFQTLVDGKWLKKRIAGTVLFALCVNAGLVAAALYAVRPDSPDEASPTAIVTTPTPLPLPKIPIVSNGYEDGDDDEPVPYVPIDESSEKWVHQQTRCNAGLEEVNPALYCKLRSIHDHAINTFAEISPLLLKDPSAMKHHVEFYKRAMSNLSFLKKTGTPLMITTDQTHGKPSAMTIAVLRSFYELFEISPVQFHCWSSKLTDWNKTVTFECDRENVEEEKSIPLFVHTDEMFQLFQDRKERHILSQPPKTIDPNFINHPICKTPTDRKTRLLRKLGEEMKKGNNRDDTTIVNILFSVIHDDAMSDFTAIKETLFQDEDECDLYRSDFNKISNVFVEYLTTLNSKRVEEDVQ